MNWDTLLHLPPLHPLVVHFPIAFFLSAGVMGIWHLLHAGDRGAAVVRWLLYAGAVSALVATATGLYFESFVPHRHGGVIDPVMAWHERLGIATTVLSVLVAGWAFWRHRHAKRGARGLALAAIGLACATMCTGHLGGLLVHRFGVGMMMDDEAPAVHDHEHHHEHHQ